MRDALIRKAIERAELAHEGVVRRCTNEPFFKHPERVAKMVRPWSPPAMLAAAYLHDVVEDTDVSIDDFPPRVGSLVDLLTRRPDETKADAIARIENAMDAEAALIKVADRIDNLRDGSKYFGKRWLKKYLAGAEEIARVARHCCAVYTWKPHPLVLHLESMITELRLPE